MFKQLLVVGPLMVIGAIVAPWVVFVVVTLITILVMAYILSEELRQLKEE